MPSEKFNDKVKKVGSWFSNIKTTAAAISGAILAIVTIWFTVVDQIEKIEQRAMEREKKLLSDLTIQAIKDEINPLDRKTFLECRRRDSIERVHAELLALDFMNRQDSILLVLSGDSAKFSALINRLDRLEAKLDVNQSSTDSDKLSQIWEYLKKKEKTDSTSQQINSLMQEIRRANQEKIDQIKNGDRIK